MGRAFPKNLSKASRLQGTVGKLQFFAKNPSPARPGAAGYCVHGIVRGDVDRVQRSSFPISEANQFFGESIMRVALLFVATLCVFSDARSTDAREAANAAVSARAARLETWHKTLRFRYGQSTPAGWKVSRLDNEAHCIEYRDLGIVGDFDFAVDLTMREQRGAVEIVLRGDGGDDLRLSFYLRSPFSNGANWTITTPKEQVIRPIPWGTRRLHVECRGDLFRLRCDRTLERGGQTNVAISQFVFPHANGFAGVDVGVNDRNVAVEQVYLIRRASNEVPSAERLASDSGKTDRPASSGPRVPHASAVVKPVTPASPALVKAIELSGRCDISWKQERAKSLFEEAFKSDDPLSTMWMARLLFKGRCGFEENPNRAKLLANRVFEDIVRRAGEGDPRAVFLYAAALNEGLGIAKNLEAAAKWYERIAEQGDLHAMSQLYFVYEELGDMESAIAWAQRAVDGGDVPSLNSLADCYNEAKGVERDVDKAIALYQRAVEAGYLPSIVSLGYVYANMDEPDYEKALALFRRAAERGNAQAMAKIASMYDEGQGVPRNPEFAKTWTTRAAEHGHEECQKIVASWKRSRSSGYSSSYNPYDHIQSMMQNGALPPGVAITPDGGTYNFSPNGYSTFTPGPR